MACAGVMAVLSVNLTELEMSARFAHYDDAPTPEQWADLHSAPAELEPEQRLAAGVLQQACQDWIDLHSEGHLRFEHGRPPSAGEASEFGRWLFDDGYGAGCDDFLSIRDICKALGIELSELRARLREIGRPEDLPRILRRRSRVADLAHKAEFKPGRLSPALVFQSKALSFFSSARRRAKQPLSVLRI
jgi:hypothetical protein